MKLGWLKSLLLRGSAVLMLSCTAGQVHAQSAAGQAGASNPPVRPAYSDFFELAQPGYVDAMLFVGGFRSDKYATLQQGFQLEQSITPYIGVVGRVSGYELFEGQGFANPLDPGDQGHRARLNFARLQGGIDLAPYPATHLYIFGGRDLGDSSAASVEGDFSSWIFTYSPHPLNLSFEAGYDSQNGVTSSEIDLRTVLFSRGKYMVQAGAGGAIYGGGFLSGLDGQGGPALGLYLTRLKAGLDVQSGYGTSGAYVQVTTFKVFSWVEE